MSTEERLQRLTPKENFVVGLAIGAIDVSTTQWILYCKNTSQQKLPLTFDPRVMYRGYTMSLTNMCVLSALQVPLTAMVTNMFTGGVVRRLTDVEQISSGFIGGALLAYSKAKLDLTLLTFSWM